MVSSGRHCEDEEEGFHELGQNEAMQFGKHKGKPFDKVPESYKVWMLGTIAESAGSKHPQSLRLCIHYLLELLQRE